MKINWRELRTNPYLNDLHPAMLTKKGYVRNKLAHLEGRANEAERIPVEVVFTTEYVYSYLWHRVIQKLGLTEKEMHELVADVYEWAPKRTDAD